MSDISREEAFALLKKYNQDPFHIQHALTVEAAPSLGSSSVEAALKKLVQDGTITRLGSGRKTHYVRSDALE